MGILCELPRTRTFTYRKDNTTNFPKFTEEIEYTNLSRVTEFSKIQLNETDVGEMRVDNFRHYKHLYEFRFTVYPDGYGCSNEGFVSVVFTRHFPNSYSWQLTIMINVIDDEGVERFPQSFVFSSQSVLDENQEEFVIDKYISRSVLLENDHLLPDDTLTLKVDVVLLKTERIYTNFIDGFSKFLHDDLQVENGRVILKLDSNLAILLAQKSRYFERLRVTPMMERSSSRVSFPGDEYNSFHKIADILLDDGPIYFESIAEIFELYATADKYDIAIVTDNCRSWLARCLDRENAAEILEFAEWYGDDRLREDVKPFMRRIEDGFVPDGGVPSNANGKSERSRSAATENSGNTALEFQQENMNRERHEYSGKTSLQFRPKDEDNGRRDEYSFYF